MNKPKNFYVDDAKASWHTSGRFETYEEAEGAARQRAWNSGENVAVFQVISVAEAPAEINTVKVTKV